MILTSGTTGTPKGAPRNEAGIDAAVSLLSRMPLQHGWRTHIAAPLFHTWGFAHLALAMLLGSTMVLRRKFDPEGALAAAQDERCDSLVVIPVMLQRILALPEETLAAYDLSRVKVVASSGSALPGNLAHQLDGPLRRQPLQHLRLDRGRVGEHRDAARTSARRRRRPGGRRTPRWCGSSTRTASRCPTGRPAGSSSATRCSFEGYTGGGHKEMVDGLMSTGDVGRIGEDGRLYVEGRDDEMIVSGGENVFPKEVEDCLVGLEAVAEVAAIGVDDDDYGKRLRAFVVVRDQQRCPRTTCASTSRPTSPATRCRATSSSSTSCPATRPARSSSASSSSRPTTEPGPPTADGPGWENGATMTGLSLGGPAPDFTLRDQFGQDVTLSSYRGTKAVALLFFPFAFSGVCTGEMAGIRDRLDEFLTFDTEVLAISCDPVYSLRAFADQDGLNFPLLWDFWPHGEVSRAYDVFDETKGSPLRSSYVVDRDGKVRWAVHNAAPRGARPRRAPAPAPRTGVDHPGGSGDRIRGFAGRTGAAVDIVRTSSRW